MQTPLTKAQWLDRFSLKLGKLFPGMSQFDAMMQAEQTFVDGSDLVPEEAAEIYALELPPDDSGTPEEWATGL